MISDGWFPSISPNGAYLACGTVEMSVAPITVNPDHSVTLGAEIALGPGSAPHWYNPGGVTTLLWYDRASTLKVAQPVVFAPMNLTSQQFFAYGAGGGAWAGFSATGMRFSDGTTAPGRLPVPCGPVVDQGGRTVYLTASQNAVILKGTGSIGGGGVFDRPHISQQAIVWQKAVSASKTETFGINTLHPAGIERVQASSDTEYWSIPIDTPDGPYLLSHDSTQLFLRRWGGTSVTVVATGVTDFPHAVYSTAARGFVIAWSAGGQLAVVFIPADLGAVIPVPPPGGSTPGTPPPPGSTPPASSLLVTPRQTFVPQAKPVYPHVTEIDHGPTQQTIKMLWDQVHQLNVRLNSGDIRQALNGQTAAVDATNARITAQQSDLPGDPVEARTTNTGGGPSGGPPPGGPPDPGGPPGTSSSCADSPGTGHFDPGGALTEERARKIACGTSDEWGALRAPVATLPQRETNAELLLLRIIWHLAQGGYTVGRQRNPSTAISKDKIAITIDGEVLAIDLFSNFDAFAQTMRSQWVEVGAGDYVSEGGLPD